MEDIVQFLIMEMDLGYLDRDTLDHMLQVGDITLHQYLEVILS